MHIRMFSAPTPRMVHQCTIKNNSSDPVQVNIVYQGPPPEGGGNHQEVSAADVPVGGTFRAEERTTNHGSFQTRKEIAGVEVTRADGRKQNLTAPFDGVQGIQLEWLFVVDDSQIHSVNSVFANLN